MSGFFFFLSILLNLTFLYQHIITLKGIYLLSALVPGAVLRSSHAPLTQPSWENLAVGPVLLSLHARRLQCPMVFAKWQTQGRLYLVSWKTGPPRLW